MHARHISRHVQGWKKKKKRKGLGGRVDGIEEGRALLSGNGEPRSVHNLCGFTAN